MQHHDAITGTHPVLVSENYSTMMRDSIAKTSTYTISKQLIQQVRHMGYNLYDLKICDAAYAREGTFVCP